MTQNGISYVLNASNSCPKPDFISESRFLRIPINDNYCEKLLPWLDKSIEFIGEGVPRPAPPFLRQSGRSGRGAVAGWEGLFPGSTAGRMRVRSPTWDPSAHLFPTAPLPQIKPSCPAAKSSSTVSLACPARPLLPSLTS